MFGRILKKLALIAVLLLIGLVWTVNYIVNSSTQKQLYYDVAAIPKNKVGLLLGTAKYNDKAKNIVNEYYQNRIDAAVALYMAGKIDYIIVSGDSNTIYYNEPVLMRNDLIARGVPAKKIFMDNAGFRTLDSILRCRDIFGQEQFTIISQAFHDQRAVYIANHKGIKTVAYCAKDGDTVWFSFLREKFARVKMVYDLIQNTQARYYGDKVEIKS
jgi:SanA protein